MSRSTALTWFALAVRLLEQISPLTPPAVPSSAAAASFDHRSAYPGNARPAATPVTTASRGHVQRFAGPSARHTT